MAENIADNILLQIVAETTKHNDNITKQMAADRDLLTKLTNTTEQLAKQQDEQDKVTAEHEGIQTHFTQLQQHGISNIDEDLDERPGLAIGADDTRTDKMLSKLVNLLTDNLEDSQGLIVDVHGKVLKSVDTTLSVSEQTLAETKEAKQDAKDGLELLNATAEKTFGATVAKWGKDASQWIQEQSQFSKLQGAVGADFSLLFGKMSLMQNVPFYKSITQSLKFIVAFLLNWARKKIVEKMGDRMEKMVQGVENFQMAIGKRTPEEIKEARDQRKKIKEEAQERVKKKKGDGEDAPGIIGKAKQRVKDRLAKRAERDPNRNKGAFRKGMESGKEGSDRRTKTGRKTQKQFKGMTKSMGTFGRIMASIGRALSIAVTVLSGIMTGFVAAMTAAGVTIGAVTIPVWGVVAIVIIIIALVAALIYWLYIKWDEINDWWDRMKVHLAAAMERMMLWKDKAVNWFSDMGTRLGFMIRRIIAVMLDGIAGALNYAIEMFNAIPLVPDVDWRMETGRVEAVDEERAQFEVESKKRGEELERRGIELDKAKDEKMDEVLRQQGGGSSVQQINTSQSQTSKSDVSVTTTSSDAYARKQASR